MERPAKKYYRIGEVSRLTGVEPHILRYWESELHIRPQRVARQRLYREEDINLILRVKELLYEQGYTIAGAKRLLEGETASRQEKIFAKSVTTPRSDTELLQLIKKELAAIRDMLVKP
ncbi:MAG: MerR family transcriptional regulator [Deltaproteobacteria bacterium]